MTQTVQDVNEAWTMALGRVIRNLRSDKKLTQKVLARKATISQAAMSNYESGKRDMATCVFLSLAKALDHEPHVLFDLVSREAGLRSSNDTGSARYSQGSGAPRRHSQRPTG